MNDLKFLLQTPCSIAISDNVDDLYANLKNRPAPYGEAYTADDYSALQFIANIRQQYYCDINSNEKNKVEPLALPPNLSQPIAIMTNSYSSVENNSMVAYQSQGGWAVHALNGFTVVVDDEGLCGLLYAEHLCYPVAQWLNLPYEQLVIRARQEYVRRFYSRYFYDAEWTLLPQCWIEFFIDPYFNQREERRKNSQSNEWIKFKDVVKEMSWLI